jgi:hypothetical protein
MKGWPMGSLMHHRVLVCLATLALFARSPFAVAAPPNIDPCTLLTPAEVEHVIGRLQGKPKADKEGQAAWCNYEFVNGKDAMEVWVFPAEGIDRGRKQAKRPVAVKGLGDEAFMDRGMHGLDYVDLFIKKGTVTVRLSLKETAGDEDKLKALGQKAVGRF